MHVLCAAAPAVRSGDDTEPVDPGRVNSRDEPAYALDEPTGVPHALPALRKQAEPEGDPPIAALVASARFTEGSATGLLRMAVERPRHLVGRLARQHLEDQPHDRVDKLRRAAEPDRGVVHDP